MKRPYDGFDASGGDFLAGPDAFADGDSAGPFIVSSPLVGTPPPATPVDAGPAGPNAAAATLGSASSAIEPLGNIAMLANPGPGGQTTNATAFPGGATAAQLQQALNESGLSVNGAGIKVGVISDSFNDKGGAAADEASGALPSASNIQVLEDLSSGGTDEGRAMMQIVHEIAPGASLAFYTADVSEQDFANGILALAAAGCKVICDDVSYFDEPMFQNGIVAQAIQTVEAEGVTYVAAAANNASNAYQAAWTHSSGSFDGWSFTDAESFGGSISQTITVTASTAHPVPLLLEWDRAYGQASFSSGQPDIDMWVFQNGSLIAQETNATAGEANNPFTGFQFTVSGTYQIVITNNFGSDPGTIKEVLFGNGAPVSISGANAGTVYGHSMTPGAITAGAVSVASTPAFGVNPAVSETFSSSGAGTELLFANDGTRLSSPLSLSPVVVSGPDGIATTVSGGLSDFFGTSAASASLAGVAALILAENPFLTPAQVEQIMQQTALPMTNSAVSGAGLVQVDPAVAAAEALLPQPVAVEAFGSTELAQLNNDYFLDPVTGGIGPELKYGGAPVTAGEFVWTPIGAEQTSTGYEIALKSTADGSYTVWNTDSSGNVTYDPLGGAVSGTSTALESAEVSFHQDLNGDGVIGIPVANTTVIEAKGSTELVQVGNDYFLNPVSGGTGPELKYGGAPDTVGEFVWTPIGAEQTSTGYEIALKSTVDGSYTVWNTDSSGNVTYDPLGGAVSGTSTALENYETSFHQDLNGDGVIGIPVANTTVIEAKGSTELAQVGNDYFLNPVSGGTGPELKYGGAPVTAGEFVWTPIGAEQTSTGYEIALKSTADGSYTVWNTDSSGNVTYDPLGGAVSGTSTALENYETSFHQDLNGDNVIGIPGANTTVIEAKGSTELVQVGNDYFLNPVSGGTGPELKYGGAPDTVGEFVWTPIGAEQTSTGYEIALKSTADGSYTVWNTDSSGNVTYDPLGGAVSGTSTALENYETSFHQDLNGDGVIGIPGQTSSSTQVASVAPPAPASFSGGDTFTFRAGLGSGTGSSGATTPAPQQAGDLIAPAATHIGVELQHTFTSAVHELIGSHDDTLHGPSGDLAHAFIIH